MAYIDSLKNSATLCPSLDFTFAFLGHSLDRPVDASKFLISSYEFNPSITPFELPVKELQELFVHIYFLALKHTPGIVKSWWIDCKSRRIVQSVEYWTEKYFSPLIISDELDEVAAWVLDKQNNADEDRELKVKVSKRAMEVNAGIEVDDQILQIVI